MQTNIVESVKNEILSNPKAELLCATASYILKYERFSFESNKKLLPYEQVLKICVRVLNVEESAIRTKQNENNLFARTLFTGAALLYCETSLYNYGKLAKYICGNSASIRKGRSWSEDCLSNKAHWSWFQMMQVLLECEKVSKGRIIGSIKPNLNWFKKQGGFVENANNTWKLSASERTKIIQRSFDWFHNNNKKKKLIAYSPDGAEISLLEANNKEQDQYLCTLQTFGYRFVEYDEVDELMKLTEEHLRKSNERLEETKWLLEATNRQFFSQSTDEISFNSLKAFGYSIKIYENQSRFLSLSRSRITNIPKRDSDWFKGRLSLIAYSANAKEIIFIGSSILSTKEEVLYQLQDKGYRFIENSNEGYLSVAKDCTTCRFANICPLGMKTSAICPATEQIKKGAIRFSITENDYDNLIKIQCEQ